MGDNNDLNTSPKCTEDIVKDILNNMQKLKNRRKKTWKQFFLSIDGILFIVEAILLIASFNYVVKTGGKYFISDVNIVMTSLNTFITLTRMYDDKKTFTYLYNINMLDNINKIIDLLMYNEFKDKYGEKFSVNIYSVDIVTLDNKIYLKIIYI